MDRAVRELLDREQHRLDAVRSRPVLARPESLLEAKATEVVALRERAGRTLHHRLHNASDELRHTLARLRALSPLATLERGYAIVRRSDDGHVVRAPDQVAAGDAVRLTLAGGEVPATIGGS